MKNCIVVMSKSESHWRGSVESDDSSHGAEVFFEHSSDSPSFVLTMIRAFLSENNDLKVVKMIRNGNPKWLGYYATSLNMNLDA